MNSSSDESKKFNKCKFFAIVGIIGLISLVIIYYLEKLSYSILNSLLYFDILTLIVFFSLHILLVRAIVHMFLFPGANFFIKKLMRYESGRFSALNFLRQLTVLKKNLELLKTTNSGNLSSSIIKSARTSKNY